jgi:hypothetical protein
MMAAFADWPPGYALTVSLTLTQGAASSGFGRRRDSTPRRPYVAVWIETTSGKLIRVLAFWANKTKYYPELSGFWNVASRDQNLLYATARATREPGRYQLVWDGLDDSHKPAPLATYRIVVETNQEHGMYAKQAGTIVCGNSPANLTLPATANFETVNVQYGGTPKSA